MLAMLARDSMQVDPAAFQHLRDHFVKFSAIQSTLMCRSRETSLSEASWPSEPTFAFSMKDEDLVHLNSAFDALGSPVRIDTKTGAVQLYESYATVHDEI